MHSPKTLSLRARPAVDYVRTTLILACLVAVSGGSPAAAQSRAATIDRGDLNCDGRVTFADLEPFACAVVYPQAWCSVYGRSWADLLATADFSGDGTLSPDDIRGFSEALIAAVGTHGTDGGGPAQLRANAIATLDLDIDSDNTNGYGRPDYSQFEDEIEDNPHYPGKYIEPNAPPVPLVLRAHGPWDPNEASDPAVLSRIRLGFYTPTEVSDLLRSTPYASGDVVHAWQKIGDLDCNRKVNFADIAPFTLALTSPSQYAVQYPNCDIWQADVNANGVVSFDDINPFVAVLVAQTVEFRALLGVQRTAEALQGSWNPIEASDPNDSDVRDRVFVKPYTGCDTVEVACEPNDPNETRCWYANGEFCALGAPAGYPLHLNVIEGFGPVDLPPLKNEPALSSSPLVSRGGTQYRLNPHAERATQADLIDVATTMPLLQDVDFELPFGGATFRHVRTYSENFLEEATQRLGHRWGCSICEGAQCEIGRFEGTFWDWNGRYWMMGENPILLIDAAYTDVADWKDEGGASYGERICYFIPDAHHAIPFHLERQNGSFVYIAPPWFDAQLDAVGGERSTTEPDKWVTFPTNWVVRLNGGAIKYTFKPYYNDLWTYVDSSAPGGVVDVHDHPRNPIHRGHGLPYYGIVTSIEDPYGNYVENIYSTPRRVPCADLDLSQPSCSGCCVTCNERGQLRAVKLRTGGANGQVVWTLLYTHRRFGGPASNLAVSSATPMRQNMLHAIHVYPRDIDVPDDLTLDFWEHFATLQSFDEYDAVDADVPGDWTLRAKYTYNEIPCTEDGIWNIYGEAPADSQYGRFAQVLAEYYNSAYSQGSGAYQLLKVTVSRQSTEVAEPPRSTIYRYQDTPNARTFSPEKRHLQAFWSAEHCETLVREAIVAGTATSVNDLLCLRDCNEITPGRPFGLTADVTLHRRVQNNGNACGFVQALRAQGFLEQTSLQLAYAGFSDLVDRRGDKTYHYAISRFKAYPEGMADPLNDCEHPDWPRAHIEYHWPYRYATDPYDLNSPVQPLPATRPFIVTMIDCAMGGVEDANEPTRSRRIVELAPNGLILRDRKWEWKSHGPPTLIPLLGYNERRFYDHDGRVVMQASKGWGSQVNSDPFSAGLVHVFKYAPTENNRLGELVAAGVRSGTGVDPNAPFDPNDCYDGTFWTQAFERDANNPQLITAETRFAVPVANPSVADPNIAERVTYEYTFQQPLDHHSAVRAKTVRRAPNTAIESREQYVYNAAGNIEWSGRGDNVAFYANFTGYDGQGRITRSVEDADPCDPQAVWPDEWGRGSSPAPALHYETTYAYDDAFGLTRVTYPNGRELHMVYRVTPDGRGLNVWEYKDVLNQMNGTCRILGGVKLTTMTAGRPAVIRELRLNQTSYPPAGENLDDPNIVFVTTTTPTYNAGGQVTGVRKEGGGSALQATVGYYFGDLVSRQEEPDGTITRHTYDNLNRLTHTFRGTADQHPVWGNVADPNDPNQISDNLLLIEKREYGAGVTDADELVLLRHYRQKPDNQYQAWGSDPNANPADPNSWENGVLPNEDTIGWSTHSIYDWRMRPVWSIDRDPNGVVLRQQATWYDNLDRVVMTAEYGPTAAPGGVDPKSLTPGWSLPSPPDDVVHALFTPASRPTIVTTAEYNARGLKVVDATWRWHDRDTNGQFEPNECIVTRTQTVYDGENRPRIVYSAGAPEQHTTYDARGRQTLTSSVVVGVTLSQSLTRYDTNNCALETAHTEYTATAPNVGITSYVQNWYDEAGRLTTSANWGTNNAADAYAPGNAPPVYDPNAPPVQGSTTALVTTYEYDELGRQTGVRHPDGTLTRTVYDDLGRVTQTIENADDASAYRCTAYLYDPNTGTLTAMAAISPCYNNYALPPAHITWPSASTDDFQVTTFEYGGEVGEATWNDTEYAWLPEWSPTSSNKGWISRVTYPHASGDAGGTLEFRYYSDGAVASRRSTRDDPTEANDPYRELWYRYDEGGQLLEIAADGYSFNGGMSPPLWAPAETLRRVTYGYDDQPVAARSRVGPDAYRSQLRPRGRQLLYVRLARRSDQRGPGPPRRRGREHAHGRLPLGDGCDWRRHPAPRGHRLPHERNTGQRRVRRRPRQRRAEPHHRPHAAHIDRRVHVGRLWLHRCRPPRQHGARLWRLAVIRQ
jgi:YD repeat-containing protein